MVAKTTQSIDGRRETRSQVGSCVASQALVRHTMYRFRNISTILKMKVYTFAKAPSGGTTVTVDGEILRMARFRGEPADLDRSDRLAFSILLDAYGDAAAEVLESHFYDEVVKEMSDQSEIPSEDIKEWVEHECALGYAVQTANWTPVGSGPPEITKMPPNIPQLTKNPNYRRKGGGA